MSVDELRAYGPTRSKTWSKNIDTGSDATFVGCGDKNFAISDRLVSRDRICGISRASHFPDSGAE